MWKARRYVSRYPHLLSLRQVYLVSKVWLYCVRYWNTAIRLQQNSYVYNDVWCVVYMFNMWIYFVCLFLYACVLACICRLNIYLQGYTKIILESCEEISLKIKKKIAISLNQENEIKNFFGNMATILQNGRFADYIFKCVLLNENVSFRLWFHCVLLWAQLTIL